MKLEIYFEFKLVIVIFNDNSAYLHVIEPVPIDSMSEILMDLNSVNDGLMLRNEIPDELLSISSLKTIEYVKSLNE